MREVRTFRFIRAYIKREENVTWIRSSGSRRCERALHFNCTSVVLILLSGKLSHEKRGIAIYIVSIL